jgi:hypothetical protein
MCGQPGYQAGLRVCLTEAARVLALPGETMPRMCCAVGHAVPLVNH